MDDKAPSKSYESAGQAGSIVGYEGRGVWVPRGLTAAGIMAGAAVLERDFSMYEIPPYVSRAMASAVLVAAKSVLCQEVADEIAPTASEAKIGAAPV